LTIVIGPGTRTLSLEVSLLRADVHGAEVSLRVTGGAEPVWRAQITRFPEGDVFSLESTGTGASDGFLATLASSLGSERPARMRSLRVLSIENVEGAPERVTQRPYRGTIRFNDGTASLRLSLELDIRLGTLTLAEEDGHSLSTLAEVCSTQYLDPARVRLVRHYEANEATMALASADEALAVDPNDAQTWVYRGLTQLELVADSHSARASFSSAIALLQQPSGSQSRRLLQLALNGRATCHENLGALAAAVDDLTRLIEIPAAKLHRFNALLQRGRSRHRLGETMGALSDLTQAISLGVAPVANAYLARADVLRSLGRVEEAEADTREAVARATTIKSLFDFFEGEDDPPH
jgi:hypothetical protein